MKEFIVAVCSCPAGVAHTYMAADRLAKVAKKLGYDSKIETQGMAGIEDRLTQDDLERANVIIMANEIALREPERFENYKDKMVYVSISRALNHAEEVIKESVR